jgi:hypothetical protein
VTHRSERTLDIEPLGGSQLGAIAALVEHEYARLREEVPALPADALSPTRVVPLLEYKRMSVDFETANAGARRFWLRTFLPVCVSLVRRIDGRLVPAEATR